MKWKRAETISRKPGYHVYKHDGRFYINMFRNDAPIHSYATIEGVKEALYYAGKIDSRTEEI